MKSLSKMGLLTGSLMWLIRLAPSVSAADSGIPLDSFRPTSMATDTNKYFGNVIDLVFIVAAALVFFYLIYGAIGWITSNGDAGKLQTAKSRMVQAVIGLLVLSCVWALYTLVMTVVAGEGWRESAIPVLGS